MEQAEFFAANVLARIAFDAVARSAQAPDDNLVAALFSAAWIEAAINELIYHLTTIAEENLDPALHETRRSVIAADLFDSKSASVELKLRTLCAAITRQQLPAGAQPWQRLFLLLELRNWLLHLRPERMKVRMGTEEEPSLLVSQDVHRLVKSLRSAGAIAFLPEGRLVPVAIAAGLPGVGNWSYTTAYESLAAVASWHRPWWRDLFFMVRKPVQM